MKKIIVILLVSICLCGCNKENEIKKNDININDNKNVIEEKIVDGIKFSNISIIEKNQITSVEVTLTNTTKETKKAMFVNLILKDKRGNKVNELLMYIPNNKIEPNESKTVSVQVTDDLTDIYSLEYELK